MESTSPIQLARKTIGLVLAGGRGSRLKQLTDRRTKPAVYFGGKFRIIDFALSNCMNSGVSALMGRSFANFLKGQNNPDGVIMPPGK